MTAIEGIFFDLDGTLVDTADDFVITINRMLADAERAPMEPECIRRNVSAGSRILMQMAFELTPGDALEQKRNEFLHRYDCHIQDKSRPSSATLYPYIPELLNNIEQQGITWGIVTNKPRPYALKILEQLELLDRSAVLVCPEDVSKTKPHPEALLQACQKTRCTPERSLYIGDHGRDIQAGKAAKMLTVAALYGYIADSDDPSQWQADLSIQNVSELNRWLEQKNWAMT